MKTILTAVALLSLAACDNGGVIDQSIRSGVRESAVQACTTWLPQSDIAAAASLDPDRLCGCAADRLLEKGASPLAELTPESAEVRTAMTQCVAEMRSQPREAKES